MARPRNFDEDSVLDAVAEAFWTHGYEGTSTRDLVQYTGLTQPSLYNAFGDKRALFLRALDHYLEHTLRERIQRLESSMPPDRAITAFFREIVERSVSDEHRRGCMLVNAALGMSPEDEEFRELIAEEMSLMRAFFERCMKAGLKSGAIERVMSADAAATSLLAVLLGVRVLARVDPKPALLSNAVGPTLAMLKLPPLGLSAGKR
ncbi:TetR family transcriptional regulator [Caballeronia turbans]|jgi:TetR/AcrR family transcriptional repressor of nem operon|uniref:TetR/AcrR family transcriptional regulator n=1 Tax=unclassified Caballeronia TaxID=2646786 RepID=UPI00074CB1F3|nr:MULTISPECIES: TetR/AcrR family transcriptional regulator [unclassified Caballeronia]SAL51775.1 TetR family transcriptional regulator [Caballeronia turbans]